MFWVTVKSEALGKLASVNRLADAVQTYCGGRRPDAGCFGADYVQLEYKLAEAEVGPFVTALALAPIENRLTFRVMAAE